MAPEQSSGPVLDAASLTPRTDVYAFACTAFELLTGEPPFRSGDVTELWRLHAGAPAPLLSSVRPDLSPLDPVVARALEKDPQKRFPTCEAFANALARAAIAIPQVASIAAQRTTGGQTTSLLGALLRTLIVSADGYRALEARSAFARAAGSVANATDIAKDPARALAELTKAPDVIVLDFDSLGADALPLLASIRDRREGGRARIVVIGKDGVAGERWRYPAYGVRDFVDAPTAPTYEAVFRAVGRRMGWAR
jgi:CheY-like chemotaxis protein